MLTLSQACDKGGAQTVLARSMVVEKSRKGRSDIRLLPKKADFDSVNVFNVFAKVSTNIVHLCIHACCYDSYSLSLDLVLPNTSIFNEPYFDVTDGASVLFAQYLQRRSVAMPAYRKSFHPH